MIKLNYSNVSCYQICNHQFFHRVVAKDVKFVETAPMRHGNHQHKAFEQRLSSGTRLPEDMQQFEPTCAALDPYKPQTEVRLGMRADGSPCGFYDDDCWVNTKIDVWMEVQGYGLIWDWKSGKRREDDLELRINALLAYVRNPELRTIKARYFWTGEGPAGTLGTEHDCSDFQRTFAELESISHHIEESAQVNHWPKREGPLCKWCGVASCNFNKNPDIALYR